MQWWGGEEALALVGNEATGRRGGGDALEGATVVGGDRATAEFEWRRRQWGGASRGALNVEAVTEK